MSKVVYKNSLLSDIPLTLIFVLFWIFLVSLFVDFFGRGFSLNLVAIGIGILGIGIISVMFVINIFRGLRKFEIIDDMLFLKYSFNTCQFRFDELRDVKVNVFGGKVDVYRIVFVSPQGKKFYIPLTGEKGKEVFNFFKQKIINY